MNLPAELLSLFTPGVTDLLISGADNAWIDSGAGLERVASPFTQEAQLQSFAIGLAIEAGSRADIAKPIADFSIDNFRIQVVLPFGVSPVTQLSIRRHPGVQVTLDHLVEADLITLEQSSKLRRALDQNQSILITGPTSAGKTTLLSALVHQGGQRTICIEQTPELYPAAPAISLIEREPNQEGRGEISLNDLIRHALRMRPDRLVLGEARGSEFGSLLLAMNNGHSAMATLHSRDLESLPARFAVLSQLAGFSQQLTNQLILGSVDLVVHLSKTPWGRRAEFAFLEQSGSAIRAVRLEV